MVLWYPNWHTVVGRKKDHRLIDSKRSRGAQGALERWWGPGRRQVLKDGYRTPWEGPHSYLRSTYEKERAGSTEQLRRATKHTMLYVYSSINIDSKENTGEKLTEDPNAGPSHWEVALNLGDLRSACGPNELK